MNDIAEAITGLRAANMKEQAFYQNRVDHLLYMTRDNAKILIVGPREQEGTDAILKEPQIVAGSYYGPQLEGFLYERDGNLLLRPEPGKIVTPLFIEDSRAIRIDTTLQTILGLGKGAISHELRSVDVLSPAALEAKIRAYDPALRT